jgi:hypothetical protein
MNKRTCSCGRSIQIPRFPNIQLRFVVAIIIIIIMIDKVYRLVLENDVQSVNDTGNVTQDG